MFGKKQREIERLTRDLLYADRRRHENACLLSKAARAIIGAKGSPNYRGIKTPRGPEQTEVYDAVQALVNAGYLKIEKGRFVR